MDEVDDVDGGLYSTTSNSSRSTTAAAVEQGRLLRSWLPAPARPDVNATHPPRHKERTNRGVQQYPIYVRCAYQAAGVNLNHTAARQLTPARH